MGIGLVSQIIEILKTVGFGEHYFEIAKTLKNSTPVIPDQLKRLDGTLCRLFSSSYNWHGQLHIHLKLKLIYMVS